MYRKEKNFDEIVKNMKSLGDRLIPYTYPQTFSSLFDSDLDVFREREVYLDGYSLMVYYQKSDFGDYFFKTVQIYNRVGPFLPFNIVFKVATKFLGTKDLSLVEIFKSNRKVYCWSLATDHFDAPIDPPYETKGEYCHFEGFSYFYITPSYVNFY
jgi:hypothetical protein